MTIFGLMLAVLLIKDVGCKRKNFVRGIFTTDGEWVNLLEDIQKEAVSFYSDLFSSNDKLWMDEVVSSVQPVITEDVNANLIAPFTPDEVYKAFKQIHPLKATGVDGLPVVFFHSIWPLLGAEVTTLCLDLLAGRISMASVNQTVLVLLLKVDDSTRFQKFCPIALCRVICKIVSKSLKYDMEKAYDCIEWPFLGAMLERLGFHQSWVDLVMNCVTSVSYCIRISGKQSESFKPTRGLRQGPPSAHLLFADDCILFFRPSMDELLHVQKASESYSQASGQLINYHKSSLFCGSQTPVAFRIATCQTLGVEEVSDPGFYLGLPLIIGRNKRQAFSFIRNKLHSRVQGWSKNLISYGDREVYIKSAGQALPTYAMGCYLLPTSLVSDLNRLLWDYWWTRRTENQIWVEILARDEAGMVIAGQTLSLEIRGEPCIAEAYAISIGLLLGLSLGAPQVIIECDSTNIVRQLMRETLDLSVYRFHLEEALRLWLITHPCE
ncbi:hypothetical protein F3Y22_tig00110410pilonHSYRG00109 [Hibiscus syriacus]|uniref:RNase H type-1 domain-containing protein n=1 Tax=Hibiscus syriacus TaxID=106335 RepID=A0A6A3AQD8_HIBSY|nr:hypothetical protein F3Y22_tig00110410pilonHSYRG00109 [Hibiscus syriacus]